MPTDTEVASPVAPPQTEAIEAAPQVPADGASTAMALPAGVSLEGLAQQIEAIVVTSGRPVPVKRLGQALGLIAPDEAAPSSAAKPEGEQPAEGGAEVVVKPKRSRKKAAGVVEPEKVIAAAVTHLNGVYRESGRTFSIELLAGGYRMMTLARWRGVIASFHGLSAQQRMSKASVETMAIIAYKQPITRAKLEAIRGVACGEVLRSLIERRLVTIVGRAEELGRPMLYGTTKGFLEAFGLASLKDLPSAAEMAVLKRQG
ncbi:MAG TPA: SMC-Scp complex subunit ScpB [Phycisphaerales bacterium]|nr:SMC-Scp complex subunit ScpB [Phycisphaerales bacterium]